MGMDSKVKVSLTAIWTAAISCVASRAPGIFNNGQREPHGGFYPAVRFLIVSCAQKVYVIRGGRGQFTVRDGIQIRVYDADGNLIETHVRKGDFKEW